MLRNLVILSLLVSMVCLITGCGAEPAKGPAPANTHVNSPDAPAALGNQPPSAAPIPAPGAPADAPAVAAPAAPVDGAPAAPTGN